MTDPTRDPRTAPAVPDPRSDPEPTAAPFDAAALELASRAWADAWVALIDELVSQCRAAAEAAA